MHHENELPKSFSNYFTVNSSVHLYGTQIREDLHITSVSTNLGKRSVRHKASMDYGTAFWNL